MATMGGDDVIHVLHPDSEDDRWSLGSSPSEEDTSASELIFVIVFAAVVLFALKIARKYM